jgi:hypothetical protein
MVASKFSKSLPIFFTKDGSARQKSHCVSVADVNLAAPTDKRLTIPVACARLLLNLEDNASVVVAESLGIRPSSVSDILASVYFPDVINGGSYNIDEVENLMKFVCENLKEFERISYQQISIGWTGCISEDGRQQGRSTVRSVRSARSHTEKHIRSRIRLSRWRIFQTSISRFPFVDGTEDC